MFFSNDIFSRLISPWRRLTIVSITIYSYTQFFLFPIHTFSTTQTSQNGTNGLLRTTAEDTTEKFCMVLKIFGHFPSLKKILCPFFLVPYTNSQMPAHPQQSIKINMKKELVVGEQPAPIRFAKGGLYGFSFFHLLFFFI